MMDEDAYRSSETKGSSSLLSALLTSLVVRIRLCGYDFDSLLEELKRSLNSGGTGVDREPIAVMRDLDRAVSSLHDLAGDLVELNQEPDWDARVRAIANENGGFCAITFYARDDMPDLRRRASREEQRAEVHLQAIWLMFKGFEPLQPPPRCVVCSEVADAARRLELIMVLEGYGANPKLTVAGGICAHCASKHRSEATLRNAVVNGFRERLRVDLRVLDSAPVLPGPLH
jgi:hypothetical protein